MKRINKVAILGAGTMGARIAAHFANAGVPSYLLDIVPADAAPGASAAVRNKIAAAGLDAAKKSKPAAFMDAALARFDPADRPAFQPFVGQLMADAVDIVGADDQRQPVQV